MLGLFIVVYLRDNAGRIKERAWSEKQVFVQQHYHSAIGMYCSKNV